MDWASPETAKIEAEFLIENACPQMPDADLCETNLLTWWEHVAAIIFSQHMSEHMCQEINSECEVPEIRYFQQKHICLKIFKFVQIPDKSRKFY